MPSGLYERTPRILENVRKAHRLLWETRGIEIAQNGNKFMEVLNNV